MRAELGYYSAGILCACLSYVAMLQSPFAVTACVQSSSAPPPFVHASSCRCHGCQLPQLLRPLPKPSLCSALALHAGGPYLSQLRELVLRSNALRALPRALAEATSLQLLDAGENAE